MINKNRIILVGDSIAAGVNCDTDQAENLLGKYLGLPQENTLAVSGTTAEDWADDKDDMLTDACKFDADLAIVSLLANDASKAIGNDGAISCSEVYTAACHLLFVVEELLKAKKSVALLEYSNPYPANAQYNIIISGINFLINVMAEYSRSDVIKVKLDEKFFNGTNIHPNQHGYELIANEIKAKYGL